ncbi:MAG: tRNA (uridine(34)/cytosine(34)/5-carboxymethylaminomethyluridine(34)-2'-O)-methyltransferase TrmL [Gammaproteobacteria bacterium]|nr:tRNA (uridine(34)/cytosine(34)/5-carboxymethylaminomethyluridine(34)-2'-O)-methyltransferase TrmL [Gammaproteobacteria bacterium]
MFNIVLFEPEIPPNTGNIIRLCANTGSQLHLIKPLGFELDDKRLRRAGLDYHEFANINIYDDFDEFLQKEKPQRMFACTTKAQFSYAEVEYRQGDTFIFGPETRGLPESVRLSLKPENNIRISMLADSRSLNLSNAVAVILYEAWRQQGFKGAI